MSIFPISMRELDVLAIDDVTPNLRRLTLGGPDMLGGTKDGHPIPAFRSDGFDDHVKIVFPDAEGHVPHPGTQADGTFDWAPGVLPITRDYTVRSVADDGGSFTIDIVRHGHGRASGWAGRCEVGDSLFVAGPKASATLTPGIDWHLLVGDETALPAIGRWLEEAPAGVKALVVVEVPTEADKQELVTAADADITWLVRGADTPPGHSTQLFETLTRLVLPQGRGYAWCAGETLTMVPIRRHLRGLGTLEKDDIEVVGYWRRVVGTDPGAPVAPSPRELAMAIHEMSELLPPLALRLAVTLGIPMHVNGGVSDEVGLALATGVPQDRLRPVLDALVALELLAHDGAAYTNTALGEALLEENAQEHFDLRNPANRADLAILDVLATLTDGGAATGQLLPAPVPQWRAQDAAADAAFQARAVAGLEYNLGPLADLPEVSGAQSIVVLGDGADVVAESLAEAAPNRDVRVAAPEQIPGRSDVVIALGAFDTLPDDAVVSLATTLLAAASTHLILVGRNSDEAPTDDHVAADSLTALAQYGVALRRSSETAELMERAGGRIVRTGPLGWGFGASVTVVAPREGE